MKNIVKWCRYSAFKGPQQSADTHKYDYETKTLATVDWK